MSQNDLKQLEPEQALQMYLESHRYELRESTIKSKRSRLGMFVDYCKKNEIESLSHLDGIDIHQYRIEQADGIARRTLISRLSSVRTFLKWAESVEAVEAGFHEKVLIPDADSSRSRMINSDRAKTVLDHLRRYEYATRDHLVIRLFWRTGMRLGALRGLDLDDYSPTGNDETDDPFLQLRHRPDTGTPLKNGKGGERPIGLSEETRLLIDDYLENNRVDITDENDRAPLLTTKRGRPGIATYRRTVYRYTRPCEVGGDCPHEIETHRIVKPLRTLIMHLYVRQQSHHMMSVEEQ